jgi:glycosyltransferase involved in cell wall biosynthesis
MWAYVITHPIQYYTPVLQELERRAPGECEALYCSAELEASHSQSGFGVAYRWDVPLLEGYRYRFLRNRAAHPSTTTFGGLDNPELSALIASRRYDAVAVNGWHFKSAWRVLVACWRHGVPVLVRSDSHLRGPVTLRKLAKGPFFRGFIPHIDGCLAAGSWSYDYFEKYGASSNHIFKIPHCVDNRRFEQDMVRLGPERQQLRRQWGIPEDATVFLFAGKFIDVKRPADFVGAVGSCAAKRPSVVGLMAGDGPLRAQSEEQARRSGAPVRFAGFLNQSRISEAYAVADALVLPSQTETWGLVVNEAMASGLPCIVSDQVGCGPDVIERGITGDVHVMGDVEDLAEVLMEYAGSGRLASMSAAARRKMEAYSVPAAAGALASAVETVRRRK